MVAHAGLGPDAAGGVGGPGRELSRWLGTGALPPEAEEPLRSPGGLSGRQGTTVTDTATCPARPVRKRGLSAGHVRDRANTDGMNRHLSDIVDAVPRGRHALVAPGGAGWHRPRDPEIPDGVSLPRLPPCSPEPNLVGTVFRSLRQRNSANPVLATAGEVTERAEKASSDFTRTPDRIGSPGRRSRAGPTGAPAVQPVQHISSDG